ncbi:uncharacterized protein CLIB1423_11S00210 [[Candida] railenensis]|uniref:LisH domain-containing protein n=1 Tax=[Candida] railenensis TaxID=45579 RepID=A0A9P0QQ55_9ASCO|nr:uncharacterized protein CLIB1423_11S00210 [[Candida] railenensis]
MSAHSLIAHFLKENNYHDTLKEFEREHGKPIEVVLHDNESLADIVLDRNKFRSIKQEEEDDGMGGKDDFLLPKYLQEVAKALPNWTTPYPKEIAKFDVDIHGLIVSSCLTRGGLILVSTNDCGLYAIDWEGKATKLANAFNDKRAVVKKIVEVDDNFVVLVGMDGSLSTYSVSIDGSVVDLSLVDTYQAHKRMVTDVQVYHSKKDGSKVTYLVSLGWDFHVKVFQLVEGKLTFLRECKLTIQGTCFSITTYKGGDYIIVGKNEHTLLDVYDVETLTLQYKISLNDAIFSTAGFTPRCIITNGELIVVGTSHEPFMRLIVVSLTDGEEPIRRNQIIRNLNTLSPQDKFSSAILAWRKDQSGVWVAGEDGTVRGIDFKQQRVITEIPLHKGKVKTFISGVKEGSEVILSSGIDRELKSVR